MSRLCPIRSNRSPGFTLIELLVVISVIGLLIALILPAVQRSRESARRMACANNLRQIGIAIQNFQSAHTYFPPAAPNDPSNGTNTIRVTNALSPQFQILEFLEGVPLSVGASPNIYVVDSPEGLTVRSLRIEVFLCPSETSPLLQQVQSANSYRANIGASPYFWDETLKNLLGQYPGGGGGAFSFGFPIRPGNFSDGLSHTAFMSEKLMGGGMPEVFNPLRDYWCVGWAGGDYPPGDQLISICRQTPAPPIPFVARAGRTWSFADFDSTWYNHSIPPNSAVPGCKVDGDYPSPELSSNHGGLFGASGVHGGGVNSLFGDGSVHFIKDLINPRLWQALATRAGSEVINDGDW